MRKFGLSDVELWLIAVCGNSAVHYVNNQVAIQEGRGLSAGDGSSSSSGSVRGRIGSILKADGQAVAVEYMAEVKMIVTHLSTLMKEGAAAVTAANRPGAVGAGRTTVVSLPKEDRSTAVFGGVTISDRAIRYKKELLERKKNRSLSSSHVVPDTDGVLTAGQWLARLNLSIPLKSNRQAEQWFRDAIRSTLSFSPSSSLQLCCTMLC